MYFNSLVGQHENWPTSRNSLSKGDITGGTTFSFISKMTTCNVPVGIGWPCEIPVATILPFPTGEPFCNRVTTLSRDVLDMKVSFNQ